MRFYFFHSQFCTSFDPFTQSTQEPNRAGNSICSLQVIVICDATTIFSLSALLDDIAVSCLLGSALSFFSEMNDGAT